MLTINSTDTQDVAFTKCEFLTQSMSVGQLKSVILSDTSPIPILAYLLKKETSTRYDLYYAAFSGGSVVYTNLLQINDGSGSQVGFRLSFIAASE